MRTRKNINRRFQVKTYNDKLWVCEYVENTPETTSLDWDFISETDNKYWKILRKASSRDLIIFGLK